MEITLGVLWLVTSVSMAAIGAIPLLAVLVDVAAFIGLLIATRFHVLGSVVMVGALVADSFLPAGSLGVTGAVVYVGVIALLRARGWRAAAILTVATLAVGIWVSRPGPDGTAISATVAAWLIGAGLAWAIGIGFRGHAELSAARERERASRMRLELAGDLHDFVARDLTLITMRADAAIQRGGADVEELRAIAQHSRSAADSLRATAQQMSAARGAGGSPSTTIDDALTCARDELGALGRELVVEGAPTQASKADAMAGQLLTEALHNAIKHGEGNVRVTFDDDPSHLSVEVANIVGHESPIGGSSLGLATMRRRAETFGGEVNARLLGDEWVCRIRIPDAN